MYGVAVTVKYNEGTVREYFFNADTATKAIQIVSDTQANALGMGATVESVSIVNESLVTI